MNDLIQKLVSVEKASALIRCKLNAVIASASQSKEYEYEGWSYNSHDRKNNITYIIWKDDDFIFNYDALPYEDIDFYLTNRIDRPNYLVMIPTLLDLKAFREKEMAKEKEFSELMVYEIMKELRIEDRKKVTEVLDKCITWWKMKVISKRPLMEDDAKAWRMIRGRVKHKLNGSK